MPWRIHKVNLYVNNPDFIKFTLCSVSQPLFLKILSISLFLKTKVTTDQQINLNLLVLSTNIELYRMNVDKISLLPFRSFQPVLTYEAKTYTGKKLRDFSSEKYHIIINCSIVVVQSILAVRD